MEREEIQVDAESERTWQRMLEAISKLPPTDIFDIIPVIWLPIPPGTCMTSFGFGPCQGSM